MKAQLLAAGLALSMLVSPLGGQQAASVPTFRVDPFWPTLPDTYFLGRVRGLTVDAQDHMWIVHDPSAITEDIRGAEAEPPRAECCVSAPHVLEFDASGRLLQGWNIAGTGFDQLEQPHGIFVDHEENVWLSSERQGDHHLLKFDRAGRFLLQIGRKGESKGSNDTANVNGAADMYVWPRTNELFVADGYRNRRVVVFDARTGAYRRHWGAYGRRPDDSIRLERTTEGDPPPQFNLVHDVIVSNDALVYVADRNNQRIQVFTPDGTFVREGFVARSTSTTNATVYSLAFSTDPGQRFLYVADAANGRVRLLDRTTLQEVGAFGRWGRQAGQFMVPHSIATDSLGNLYVGEIREGRIQKFIRTNP